MSDWSEIIGRANDAVLDTFGDPENLWTYHTKDGISFPLNGIVERAPELVDLEGNVQQAGDEWTFDYRKADFPEYVEKPTQGDQLERIIGTTIECFEVIHFENDDEGMPRLRLVKHDA